MQITENRIPSLNSVNPKLKKEIIMKIKTLLTLIMLVLTISVSGQSITLTFTAVDNTAYTQLNSIKVMNRTQGVDTTLSWPDTVLVLYSPQGLPEISSDVGSFQVFQNYPNPVKDITTISMYVPDKDAVIITITDVIGRVIHTSERVLPEGYHSFRFTPGSGSLFILTAQYRGNCSSIKILNAADGIDRAGSLEYISGQFLPQIKAVEAVQDFSFTVGDTLLYIGYTNTLQSGMLDAPEASETYTFQFATNIPCPGTPTVTYEGQVYNTIQVFSQCWLKENLNVGTMIQGAEEMTDNGIMEKYCYNNEPGYCNTYGGLYQWNEMMQYTIQQGAQGICPQGWHLPTDEEWKVLEGAVDSQYRIGDNTWDINGIRGYDVGANLKTTSGWYANGNGTDLYGFSVLPGGRRHSDGSFFEMGEFGFIWASTEDSNLYSRFRSFAYLGPTTARGVWSKLYGYSVRCIRD